MSVDIALEKIIGRLILDTNFFYELKQDMFKMLDGYNLTLPIKLKVADKVKNIISNYNPSDVGLVIEGIWR